MTRKDVVKYLKTPIQAVRTKDKLNVIAEYSKENGKKEEDVDILLKALLETINPFHNYIDSCYKEVIENKTREYSIHILRDKNNQVISIY